MRWTILAMPMIIWIIPLVLNSVGLSFDAIMGWTFPLSLGLLIIGGCGSLLYKCPKCAKPVLKRGIFYTPWPERVCSRCGTDLTAAFAES